MKLETISPFQWEKWLFRSKFRSKTDSDLLLESLVKEFRLNTVRRRKVHTDRTILVLRWSTSSPESFEKYSQLSEIIELFSMTDIVVGNFLEATPSINYAISSNKVLEFVHQFNTKTYENNTSN